ncbi:MAG: hypothetical protein LUC33_02935, partial [Prevotellaceae bacterium]|nr:hypothetical protein [Prevotellaceae bacterium]
PPDAQGAAADRDEDRAMTDEQRERGVRLFARHKRLWSKEELKWLQEVMRDTTLTEIGKVIGYKECSLSRMAKAHGLSVNPGIRRACAAANMNKWHKSQRRRLLFGLMGEGQYAGRQYDRKEINFRHFLRRYGYEVNTPEEERYILILPETHRLPRSEDRARQMGYEVLEEQGEET